MRSHTGFLREAVASIGLMCVAVSGWASDAEVEVAAPGLWTVEGGSPSRSGVSLDSPLTGPFQTAWTLEVEGEIVGEPLVMQPYAVFEIRESEDRRRIQLVDLGTGDLLGARDYRQSEPLLPTLRRGDVVVRDGVGGLERLVVKYRRLYARDIERSGAAIRSMALVGSRLYLRRDAGIECWDVDRRERQWRTEGEFFGEVCIGSDGLYTVTYDDRGDGSVQRLDLHTGAQRRLDRFGHHKGEKPGNADHVGLYAWKDLLLLWSPLPVPTTTGARMHGALFDTRYARAITLVDAASAPIAHEERLILTARKDGHGAPVLYDLDERGFSEIDKTGTFDRLYTAGAAATRCRDVAYIGELVLDLREGKVLRTLGVRPQARVVPAGDRLLVKTAANRVVALAERDSDPAEPWVVVDGEQQDFPALRAVHQDGTTVAGRGSIDADERLLVVEQEGEEELSWNVADVLVAEDAEGVVRAAADAADCFSGWLALIGEDQLDEYARLAITAGVAKDLPLLEAVIEAAYARGATEAGMRRAEVYLGKLRRASGSKVDTDRADRVRREWAELRAAEASELWRRYHALPDGTPHGFRIDLLRRLGELTPDAAELRAEIVARLPENMPLGEPFLATQWLDFLETLGEIDVEFLPAPKEDHPDITPTERTLGMLSHTWRPDVVGLRSGQLLAVTTLKNPGPVARMLSLGELVCSHLEQQFAGGPKEREDRYPLTLLVFENQDDYVKALEERPGMPVAPHVRLSAGVYSPSEELSRVFIPEGEDAFRRAMSTFAHELTHQWIEQRCPGFSTAQTVGVQRGEGYWVVEGMAEWMAAQVYDLRHRTLRLNPTNDDLDLAAQLAPDDRMPWSELVSLTHAGVFKPPRGTPVTVRSRYRLGGGWMVDRVNRFYGQSSAVVQYLMHAEDGRHRRALLDYVVLRYTGRTPDFQAHFGLHPESLGRAVVEWAKEIGRLDR